MSDLTHAPRENRRASSTTAATPQADKALALAPPGCGLDFVDRGLLASAGDCLGRSTDSVVQLKDLRKQDDSVVGSYDGLGGLESSYKSSWEGQKKSTGVSYFLQNARKPGGVVAPNGIPVPTAVAHAHVKDNGATIAGVSVKEAPGQQGAQWIPPKELSAQTRAELVNEMETQTPTPSEVTNIRKVSMVTGNWIAPHLPGDDAGTLKERVYRALPGGFVESASLPVDQIYDAATGQYQPDLYRTKQEAQSAAETMPWPEPEDSTPSETSDPMPAPEMTEPDTTPLGTTVTAKKSKTAKKKRKNKAPRLPAPENEANELTPPPTLPLASHSHSEVPVAQVPAPDYSLRGWYDWAKSFLPAFRR
jgi:hypothetical protein